MARAQLSQALVCVLRSRTARVKRDTLSEATTLLSSSRVKDQTEEKKKLKQEPVRKLDS
jgi:hypothetical protein